MYAYVVPVGDWRIAPIRSAISRSYLLLLRNGYVPYVAIKCHRKGTKSWLEKTRDDSHLWQLFYWTFYNIGLNYKLCEPCNRVIVDRARQL